MNASIYLDHAAATPVDPLVAQSMQPYLTEQFYNPSAIYLSAKATRQSLETARHEVAVVIGARAGEVIFTAGATEANNLAISGVMSQYTAAKALITSIEHDSVLEAAKQYNYSIMQVDERGMLDAGTLRKHIDDSVALVSVIYASNEVGTVQHLKELSVVINEARLDRKARGIDMPLHLHTDAAQAANYLDMSVSRLGVDMMTISAAKTYGPKQVGALYVRAGVRLQPIIRGGGQEFGARSGTENVAGAIGLAMALQLSAKRKNAEVERLKKIQHTAMRELQDVKGIDFHGHTSKRLPNNLCFSLPNVDGETAVMMLDERHIQAATGSACGASKDGPSRIILALGVPPEVAERSVRLTMGRSTTEADMIKVIAEIKDIVAKG